jgi:adenylate cyclase
LPEGGVKEASEGFLYPFGGFCVWGGDPMAAEAFKRKLTAVMSADVAGYSRLMAEDEAATVKTIAAYREVMASLIKQHRGRVVDSPGDNVLAEFASVVDAVQCAVAVQKEFQARNAELPESRRMEFRIGINLGDVIEEEDRIYGDGVNIAARLEALADPGGICVSKTAFDQIETKLPLGYEYLGEQPVKNIPKPVGAYRVLMEPRVTVAEEIEKEKAVPVWQRKGFLAGGVALIVLVIAALIWNFYFRPAFEPASVEKMAFPLPDKPSIAVLPLVNISEDPKQEYFSDGLTEEIITALSKVPKIFVIARNSTFSYKGKSVKVSQVAEELGVRYVLEGSVRKAGDRVRITAQLIDALTGRHLWAERYDRDLKDIFALQDEITMNIITELQVKLTAGEQARLRAKGTENLQAYLKGLQATEHVVSFTREGNAQARRLLEEAIALDPKFSGAYSSLGITHWLDVIYGTSKSPKESAKRSFELTKKAIALDDSNPSAHSTLGWLYLFIRRQHDKAIAEGERAIALSPNGADVHAFMALFLLFAGRHEEAVRYCEQAIRLNPIPPGSYFRFMGGAHFGAGRYEEAIAAYKKALQQAPDDIITHDALTTAYSWAGRLEDARAQAAEVLRINPTYSVELRAKTLPYKNQADQERWLDGLRKAGLPETPPLPLPDKPSIAVLPFVNMSGDPKQEYFSDGITEEIISALAKVPKLFVIARTSSFKYKGKDVDVRTVGRELGVRYVLEGSVRKSGDQLRITAQLVDTKTGNHLWAERWDRKLKDIFEIQDEITMKIITELQVKLTSGEQARLQAKGTDNLEAYLKWLQAHFHFSRTTPDDNFRAQELAKEVIAIDPEYPAAYSLLAQTHLVDALFKSSKSPKKSMEQAFRLAQKALAMDDSDPLAHVALGGWIYWGNAQYEESIAELERALALNPNLVEANRYLARTLVYAGRSEEALPFIKKALRLNPVEKGRTWVLGAAYFDMGQYEKAISAWKEVIRFRPNHFVAHFSLAAVYFVLEREEEARAEAAELFRINPRYSPEALKKSFIRDPVVKKHFFDFLRQVKAELRVGAK